jgi:predicted RNA-binding Zn-ribbon protein involved in translation (DUF1610 family)
MSSVRMCDNCGFVFSENAEGWSNMTGNRMVRNAETGKMEPKNASVDYCPDCTESMANGSAMSRPKSPDTRAQLSAGSGSANG